MTLCPKCNSSFDPGKWRKKFCSRKCANSRSFSAESLEKRSKSNRLAHQRMSAETKERRIEKFLESYRISKPEINCVDCGKKISKSNKHNRCRACFFKSDACIDVLAHYNKNYKKLKVTDSFGNDVFLISSFEIKYYQWLSKNNIKWKKPDSIFYKDSIGNDHWYRPDFYLVESKEIIETKGYFWNNDKIKMKWVMEQNPNLNIKILTKKELKELGVL
jgi:hypothetical protein